MSDTPNFDLANLTGLPFNYNNSSSSYSNLLSQMQSISDANTAKSQEFAREQMAWQEIQNAKAMDFNAQQAELNRNWQEQMSNTAHQREVQDLISAGLNPILSATGGNGASVTSGATASGVTSSGASGSVDTSLNSALTGLLGSLINSATAINTANISANAQQNVASIYTAMEAFIAKNYPSNAWQAFGPELEEGMSTVMSLLEGFANKLGISGSGSYNSASSPIKFKDFVDLNKEDGSVKELFTLFKKYINGEYAK